MTEKCPNVIDECPHIQRSAEIAVTKVFAILGVDINNPEKVEEFRVNLRFGAGLRRASDKGIFAAIGVVTTMLLAALGWGLLVLIQRGLGQLP